VAAAMGAAGAVRVDFAAEYELAAATLGTGSTATVHMAWLKEPRPGIPEQVVVKVTKPLPYDDVQLVEHEVRLLAAVQQHPNVVRLHGLFVSRSEEEEETPGQQKWSIVLELCKNGDLFDAIAASPFKEPQALDVMAGLLSALVHVHSRNIVHRDVKVENILLADDGRPILTDFGLACRLSDSEAMSKKCGSPGSVAPEILMGLQYGVKVDAFSAGAVFYFMLCGQMPFLAPNITTILRKNLACKVDFRMPVFNDVSYFSTGVILALMNRDAEERLFCDDALRKIERWKASITDELASSPSGASSSSPMFTVPSDVETPRVTPKVSRTIQQARPKCWEGTRVSDTDHSTCDGRPSLPFSDSVASPANSVQFEGVIPCSKG